MIAILNFTQLPLTPAQARQIVDSIVEQSDARYICEYPTYRVYECRRHRTPEATVEAVPLDALRWQTWAVVIPPTLDGALPRSVLQLVNRCRRYEWPVVRVVNT